MWWCATGSRCRKGPWRTVLATAAFLGQRIVGCWPWEFNNVENPAMINYLSPIAINHSKADTWGGQASGTSIVEASPKLQVHRPSGEAYGADLCSTNDERDANGLRYGRRCQCC